MPTRTKWRLSVHTVEGVVDLSAQSEYYVYRVLLPLIASTGELVQRDKTYAVAEDARATVWLDEGFGWQLFAHLQRDASENKDFEWREG